MTVTYRSATHEKTGWDLMQVIYQNEDPATGAKRIANFFELARTWEGDILRRTDLVLDRWERITDKEDLRSFKSCFEAGDKLAAESLARRLDPNLT